MTSYKHEGRRLARSNPLSLHLDLNLDFDVDVDVDLSRTGQVRSGQRKVERQAQSRRDGCPGWSLPIIHWKP